MSAQQHQIQHELQKWGDSLSMLSEERKQQLAKQLWEWNAELDSGARRGPFAGEQLTGLEVFWLAICALAGPDGDLIEAEQQIRITHIGSLRFPTLCLRGANLSAANLSWAILSQADLSEANLSRASLVGADLNWVNLSQAHLSEANLSHASCIHTCLQGADLTNCRVYGVSAWSLETDEATVQTNLCITPDDEPSITVDHLEVAQFLYLMLHNEKIRQIIDTIAKKVVLILGRFTSERKVVLDALRDELRKRDYLPVVFDFEKPSRRDLTETVSTLAHMARFVIADLTDARSVPHELGRVVPNLPSVAVQPIIQEDEDEFVMFGDLKRYPWVLDTYRYHDLESLRATLDVSVIDPAERRANTLLLP